MGNMEWTLASDLRKERVGHSHIIVIRSWLKMSLLANDAPFNWSNIYYAF
jgi:hypothetical protein